MSKLRLRNFSDSIGASQLHLRQILFDRKFTYKQITIIYFEREKIVAMK